MTFYAANGNHDPPNILDYPLYNMNGNRYYTFAQSEGALAMRKVKFFAVDTVMLDSVQLAWLRRELGASDDGWEIAFFHHPLYSVRPVQRGRRAHPAGAQAGVPAVRHGRRAGRTRAHVPNGWCLRAASSISRRAPAARCAWETCIEVT